MKNHLYKRVKQVILAYYKYLITHRRYWPF